MSTTRRIHARTLPVTRLRSNRSGAVSTGVGGRGASIISGRMSCWLLIGSTEASVETAAIGSVENADSSSGGVSVRSAPAASMGSRFCCRRLVCFFDLTLRWPALSGGSRLFVTRRRRVIRLAPTFRYWGYLFTGRSNGFLLILLRRRRAFRLAPAFGCWRCLCCSRIIYLFLIRGDGFLCIGHCAGDFSSVISAIHYIKPCGNRKVVDTFG